MAAISSGHGMGWAGSLSTRTAAVSALSGGSPVLSSAATGGGGAAGAEAVPVLAILSGVLPGFAGGVFGLRFLAAMKLLLGEQGCRRAPRRPRCPRRHDS